MSARLEAAGVRGPAFVSVGDAVKLNAFLDKNPELDRSKFFVDDSAERDAYASTGFGLIGSTVPTSTEVKPPGFSWKRWFDYITSVMSLSPVPKDLKFGQVPQGVLQLGGTFALDGDEVTFAWADPIPGQHPEVEDVLKAAGVP